MKDIFQEQQNYPPLLLPMHINNIYTGVTFIILPLMEILVETNIICKDIMLSYLTYIYNIPLNVTY